MWREIWISPTWVWHDFFGHSEEMDLNVTDGSMAGHGGGDAVMVKQFVELLASGRDDEMLSSVEHSIESHLWRFWPSAPAWNMAAACPWSCEHSSEFVFFVKEIVF